jgi:hypothetical protein
MWSMDRKMKTFDILTSSFRSYKQFTSLKSTADPGGHFEIAA